MDLQLSYCVHVHNCHVLYDGSCWTLYMDDKSEEVIVFGQETAARVVSWLRRLDEMLNWGSHSGRQRNPVELPSTFIPGGNYPDGIVDQGWVKCAIVETDDDSEDEFCVEISGEFAPPVRFDLDESWVLIAVFEAEILHDRKGSLAMKTWRS